jgi:sugar lactone lactonase YvrE
MRERMRILLLVIPLLSTACGDTIIIQGDSPGVISTVAGGGEERAASGSRALEVKIAKPTQTIALENGDFYILETGLHRLLYVDSGGRIEVVAGNTTAGFVGDGQDAGQALLTSPSGIERDHWGNIYIADTGNHRVRKIDTTGIIATVAGSDVAGFYGDGLPATQAGLFKPADAAVDFSGRIYIADQGNNRIRMVDTDGTMHTICGTGDFAYNGNGIPAALATVFKPTGICVDQMGNIYIAVTGHHMVRRIDTSGTITTVAGSGVAGYGGDGGNAIGASLSSPTDVFVREDGGGFYIADQANQRVRFVDANGIIYTVAGNGTAGYNGDGLTATEAELNAPTGVSMDIFGNLYIADKENFRVRRVPFPVGTAEGGGLQSRSSPFEP